MSADLALAYYFARQCENAIEQCNEMLDRQPGFYRPHQLLGKTYLLRGLYLEAIEELQQAAILSGGNRGVLALLAFGKAMCGQICEAEQILAELQVGERAYISAVDVALVYSTLAGRDRMFEWLEKAHAELDGDLIWLGVDPIYGSICKGPHYVSFKQQNPHPA